MGGVEREILVEKIQALTPEELATVEEFVEFLLQRGRDRQLTRLTAQASESAFARIWDNPLDADYDRL